MGDLVKEIYLQRINFVRLHGKYPNTVYMSDDLVDKLLNEHNERLDYPSTKEGEYKIFNMDIIPVYRSNYVAVGLMEVSNLESIRKS